MFFESKTKMFSKTFIFKCNLVKFLYALYFLTYAGRKYILVENQISILTCKYRFHKRSEKFGNFRSSH